MLKRVKVWPNRYGKLLLSIYRLDTNYYIYNPWWVITCCQNLITEIVCRELLTFLTEKNQAKKNPYTNQSTLHSSLHNKDYIVLTTR